jgi:hypothetical protein
MEKLCLNCIFRSSDGLTLNYEWELVELSNDKTRAYFSRSKTTGTWMQNQCSLLSTRNSGAGWFLVPFSHCIVYEIKDSELSFNLIFSLHSYSNLSWKVIITFAIDFVCRDLLCLYFVLNLSILHDCCLHSLKQWLCIDCLRGFVFIYDCPSLKIIDIWIHFKVKSWRYSLTYS